MILKKSGISVYLDASSAIQSIQFAVNTYKCLCILLRHTTLFDNYFRWTRPSHLIKRQDIEQLDHTT